MNSSVYQVVGIGLQGTYALKNSWGQIMQNFKRESLAVISGCNRDLCVDDKVISTTFLSVVTVAGLQFDNRLVTKNSWGQLIPNVNPTNLVITR